MNEVLFVERREPDWRRLTILFDKADVSPVNLGAEELVELLRLYRRVTKDLSLVRTRSTNVQLIAFLNDLCARGYAIVYRPRVSGLWRALNSVLALCACTVRARIAFVACSAGMLVGFAAFAYVCLKTAPQTRDFFVPEQLEEQFDKWRSGGMDPNDASQSLAAMLFYSSHNPFVSILESAVGAATFGLGSVYSIFQNGAIVGALVDEVEPAGRVPYLFVRISPHGVTELSGGVISGAAGLVLGWALICPGRRKRGEALKDAGRDAIVLIGISIAMMCLAAPIEGFFSFNPQVPDGAKVLLAAASAVAWAFFWVGFGRESGSDRKRAPA